MASARSQAERDASGQATARHRRKPSIPYRNVWTSLSKFGIPETTGTSGGEGHDVRVSRKTPHAAAAQTARRRPAASGAPKRKGRRADAAPEDSTGDDPDPSPA